MDTARAGGPPAGPSVVLSVAIQHHPARAELAGRLLEELGNDPRVELVADPDPDAALRSPWRTYRHAIETTPPAATHRLVLQDDVIVCRGFVDAAQAAVEARPDPVVAFYVGGNAVRLGPRVVWAATQGRSWVDLPYFDWFPAVATCWPRRLLEPLTEYVDRQKWPREFRADDAIIGRFLRARGEVPYASVPSLVDHPDDVPSLIRQKGFAGRNHGRVAACWIGDCDLSGVDWGE